MTQLIQITQYTLLLPSIQWLTLGRYKMTQRRQHNLILLANAAAELRYPWIFWFHFELFCNQQHFSIIKNLFALWMTSWLRELVLGSVSWERITISQEDIFLAPSDPISQYFSQYADHGRNEQKQIIRPFFLH